AADAFAQPDRADAQVVGGERVRALDDLQAHLRRIERQRFRDLVDLDFLSEAALRRAVSALGSARRLVREHAAAVETIRGDVIRDGLQRTGVEGARDAVRSVRAAVEQRFDFHPRDRAVALDAGFGLYQQRMAS